MTGANNNGQGLQQFLNAFTGSFQQQRKPRHFEPPMWQNKTVLTDPTERYYTTVKLWCHRPTVEFPNTAICISMFNGNRSVFCRLSNIQEIKTLAEFFKQSYKDLTPIVVELAKQEEVMLAKKEELSHFETANKGDISQVLAQISQNPQAMDAIAKSLEQSNE